LTFCSRYFSRFFSDNLKIKIKEKNYEEPEIDGLFDVCGEEHASGFQSVAFSHFYSASSASKSGLDRSLQLAIL